MSHEKHIQFLVENELALAHEVGNTFKEQMRRMFDFVLDTVAMDIDRDTIEDWLEQFDYLMIHFREARNSNDLVRIKEITVKITFFMSYLVTLCFLCAFLHCSGIYRFSQLETPPNYDYE